MASNQNTTLNTALLVVGWILIVGGVVSGMWVGNTFQIAGITAWGRVEYSFNVALMIGVWASGAISGIMCFVLAKIISLLQEIARNTRSSAIKPPPAVATGISKCRKCEAIYNKEIGICPFCGDDNAFRDEKIPPQIPGTVKKPINFLADDAEEVSKQSQDE